MFVNEKHPHLIETKCNENGNIIQTMIGNDEDETGSIHYSKMALSGVHEWSIKCEHMNYNDMIGIATSLKELGSIDIGLLSGWSYWWWATDGVWRKRDRSWRRV